MQLVGYSNLLCCCTKYEHHIWKMKSPNGISFNSIEDFLQLVEYTTADYYLVDGEVLVTEKQRKPVSRY